MPSNSLPSNVPMAVETGRPVRAKKCAKPGALSLSTIAFRMPGPHHSFSVEMPNVAAPVCTASVL